MIMVAASWTTTAGAEVPVSAKAKEHFNAGVVYLRGTDPMRYELAYREFVAAYAHSPSWKIQGNLGILAHQLERYGEAIDAFTDYLVRGHGQIGAKEVKQVQEDIESLRAEVASVTLDVGPESGWIVDTRAGADAIVNRYGPFEGPQLLRVRAGHHEFLLERGGVVVATWKASLLPGDKASHVFDIPAHAATSSTSAEPPKLHSNEGPDTSGLSLQYWLWGFSGIAAGASVGMYLQSRAVQSDANTNFNVLCPDGAVEGDPTCPPTSAGDKQAAGWRTAALMTGIGSLGALAAGAAVYWLAPSESPKKSLGATALRPWANSNQVGVSGAF